MTISLVAPLGESRRLADALRSLMVPTQPALGCLGCHLVVSTEFSDPSSISYTEDWPSENDLRQQVRSERFLRLLSVMESASTAPAIQFDLPEGPRGLDYVTEARRDLTRWASRPDLKH